MNSTHNWEPDPDIDVRNDIHTQLNRSHCNPKFGLVFKEMTSLKERFFCFMVMQTVEA